MVPEFFGSDQPDASAATPHFMSLRERRQLWSQLVFPARPWRLC